MGFYLLSRGLVYGSGGEEREGDPPGMGKEGAKGTQQNNKGSEGDKYSFPH